SAPAVVCAVSPWKSKLRLYEEKLALTEPEPDNDPMWWGREVEPAIIKKYVETTGRTVKTQVLVTHAVHPWMYGHLDGITDDGTIVECKETVMREDWGPPGT